MRQTGKRGGSTRTGVRGAMLVVIATLTMLLVPALAAAIVATPATPASAPVNTAAPVLTGTPALGQTLTCSQGGWSNNPTSYSYAWLRSGVAIAGQAGSTYVVQAADQGHTISCQVTAANDGGDYTISGLPSGSYDVGFYIYGNESGNYLEQFFNGKSLIAEANSVSVTAPNATGGINAELHAGGQITGRVTAANTHAPLTEVDVCAEGTGGSYFDDCVDTNSNGEYTILGLPSGSYDVGFYPGYESGSYLQQIYNDKSSYTEATPVSVTPPNTTPGINAELLQPAEGGQISGKVTGPGDAALTHSVEVCADGIDNGVYGGCTTTGAGGTYTLSGLLPGEYAVEFYAGYEGGNYLTQYYEGKSLYTEAKAVEVTSGKTTTPINAEMQLGGQISGKVTDASTHVGLVNIYVCADEVGGYDYGNCVYTKSEGDYTIQGLPSGEYAVEFYAGYEGGNYLTQYYNDKSLRSEATNVKVIAEDPPAIANAEMHAGGQISGSVTDASTHAGLKEIYVCADEAGGDGAPEGCATTNLNGEYTIVGLSGTYNVEFYAESENVNYLSQVLDGVSVSAGGTTSGVNAEMHPGGQITGRVTDASTHAGLTKVYVCAEEIGADFENCALTTAGAASANTTSNALAVAAPNNSFTLAKAPVFESKSEDLDFFFGFPSAGTLKWSLFFKNADVGFADSLGLSLGAGESALAETAKKSSKKKSKKCKAGYTKHDSRCVHTLVAFASGSMSVPGGTVEVKVHPDSKALKALKAGHTLHVSGTFTFQSTLGGAPVTHTESAVVHLSKKAAKKHGKKK